MCQTRSADDMEHERLRYVACSVCGGSGEVDVRPIVGPYDDPTSHGVLCSACDGYGMECVPTEPVEMDDFDGMQ